MKYDRNFETVMDYVFKSEGGFSDRKNDLGGRTNKGVTQTTYNAWRKKKGLTPKDVKGITTDEAKQLYYEEFWIPTKASKVKDLREGYLLFDTALNSGPYEAKKLYEKSNGNIYQFLKNRKTFYENLIKRKPSQEENRQGWYNRLKDIENNMNEIINKGYYTPSYQNEQTPYDKGFNNINLNNDFHNYRQEELQNIRNKYLYLKNKTSIPTGFAAPIGGSFLDNILKNLPQNNDSQNSTSKQNIKKFINPVTGDSTIFTREKLSKMDSDEFTKNEQAIFAQLNTLGIPSQKEVNKAVYNNSSQDADGHWVTINGHHVLIKD